MRARCASRAVTAGADAAPTRSPSCANAVIAIVVVALLPLVLVCGCLRLLYLMARRVRCARVRLADAPGDATRTQH
jgi:hypothetical protein